MKDSARKWGAVLTISNKPKKGPYRRVNPFGGHRNFAPLRRILARKLLVRAQGEPKETLAGIAGAAICTGFCMGLTMSPHDPFTALLSRRAGEPQE
ncbi:MAG TPA: hypothetical protein VJB97_02795 [Candidatus Paceibacterota bacterium]